MRLFGSSIPPSQQVDTNRRDQPQGNEKDPGFEKCEPSIGDAVTATQIGDVFTISLEKLSAELRPGEDGHDDNAADEQDDDVHDQFANEPRR